MPLTKDRAKPAVPFGGAYRILDFVMTNLYRSGVLKIALITQYKPDSLNRHVEQGYIPIFGSGIGGRSYIRRYEGHQVSRHQKEFEGTADSVRRNIVAMKDELFDIVDIFGADHIYRMDIGQMHDLHLAKEADLTISAMPVDIKKGRDFGVLVVDDEGRVLGFEEKPANPVAMPSDPTKCLASMGNYSFKPESLEHALASGHKDFGKQVIPEMLSQRKRIFAYDFLTNTVPGFLPSEVYWRDVGTTQQYFDAHMDLLGEDPVLKIQQPKWKLITNVEVPNPSRVAGRAVCLDFIVANGVWIHDDANVRSSVISYETEIQQEADIAKSVFLGYTVVGAGTIIRNTIVDRRVVIPRKMIIGVDKDKDKALGLHVDGDITIVPREFKFK